MVLRSSSVSWVRGVPAIDKVVCVAGDSRVEVRNSKFSNNGHTSLGVVGKAHLLLVASTIANNSVRGNGGGLYIYGGVLYGGANVTLTDGSIVMDNTAGSEGGGLYVSNFGNVILTGGSRVQGNIARGSGGGLYLVGSSLTVTGGSTVQRNSAAVSGGGLSIAQSRLTLTGGSSVEGNIARNGSGGGVFVWYRSNVTISNRSTVSNNSCVGDVGGGIAVETSANTAGSGFAKFDSRGRVVADDSDNWGATSNVRVSSSTISNNTSIGSAGGGLAVGAEGTVELVNGTVLLHNSAANSSGGGVVLLGYGTLQADESVLFGNNFVGKGYVGSTIAAFGDSTLVLPHGGRLTKCSVGVYLGWSTCKAGETQQHDMCVCCPQHTFSFTNASCEACPSMGNCSGGSLVQPLLGCWSSAPTDASLPAVHDSMQLHQPYSAVQ
jgi:hypothetical protein